jgi:uncharacterized protein YkwD
MGVCVYCGEYVELPYTCKFCGESFCRDHHFPETHKCIGLQIWKEQRGKGIENWIYDPFKDSKPKDIAKTKVEKKLEPEIKQTFSESRLIGKKVEEDSLPLNVDEINISENRDLPIVKKKFFGLKTYCSHCGGRGYVYVPSYISREWEKRKCPYCGWKRISISKKIPTGLFKKLLLSSMILFLIIGFIQPNFLNQHAPDRIAPYVKKVTDTLTDIKDYIRNRIIPPPPATTPPTTEEPEETPPSTTPPPTSPPTILDPLPPGYYDKYEISEWEYAEQKFPLPNPKTYSLGIVGKYGKTKYKVFEREKKIYVFGFETESAAKNFLNLFEERIKRSEPYPKKIEIASVVIHFRYNNNGQYRGAFFRLNNCVYYLKMEFLESKDLEYIKENFFGVTVTPSPSETLAPTVTTAIPPVTEEPKPEYYELEKLIFKLINEERTKNKLRPLTWNDKIANVARKHSKDMGMNNYFDHESLDGRTLKDRLWEEIIPCSGCGENIMMQPEAGVITIINGIEYPKYLSQDELAKSIVEGWMNSPGHRENILTNWFVKSGVGIYYSNNYYYVTQDFIG